jgi:hypothetical protein
MSVALARLEFARLVFSRRRPEDFESILRFNVSPKSSVPLEQHYFYAGLALHALDIDGLYISVIPDHCAGINIRSAIQHLTEIFDQQSFEKDLVHDIMLILSKPFTTAVANFILQRHPVMATSIDEFVKTKHRNYMKEKRKKENSSQPAQSQQRKQKERAQLDPSRKADNNLQSKEHMQSAAQRIRAQLQAVADADSEDPLLKTKAPRMEWFHDVEKIPLMTLFLFAWNTGHALLPKLTHNVLPHSSEWPDIMSEEGYSEELELPPEVHQLQVIEVDLMIEHQTVDGQRSIEKQEKE